MCRKQGRRCPHISSKAFRQQGARARRIYGKSTPETRAAVEKLEKLGVFAKSAKDRAKAVSALTDPAHLHAVIVDKSVLVHLGLAKHPVVQRDPQLRAALISRSGDPRVLAVLAGAQPSNRAQRRMAQGEATLAKRIASESEQQKENRLAFEDIWRSQAADAQIVPIVPVAPVATVDYDDFDDDDLDDLTEEEMDALIGPQEDDDDHYEWTPSATAPLELPVRAYTPPVYFDEVSARELFHQVQVSPHVVETLSASQIATAWGALPPEATASAVEVMRTSPAILGRMLTDESTRRAAIMMLGSSAPVQSVAAVTASILDGELPQEEKDYALEAVVFGLLDRDLVDDRTVGTNGEIATAWLAEYRAKVA